MSLGAFGYGTETQHTDQPFRAHGPSVR